MTAAVTLRLLLHFSVGGAQQEAAASDEQQRRCSSRGGRSTLRGELAHHAARQKYARAAATAGAKERDREAVASRAAPTWKGETTQSRGGRNCQRAGEEVQRIGAHSRLIVPASLRQHRGGIPSTLCSEKIKKKETAFMEQIKAKQQKKKKRCAKRKEIAQEMITRGTNQRIQS